MEVFTFIALVFIAYQLDTAVKCLKIIMATQVALVTPEQDAQVEKNIKEVMEL